MQVLFLKGVEASVSILGLYIAIFSGDEMVPSVSIGCLSTLNPKHRTVSPMAIDPKR